MPQKPRVLALPRTGCNARNENRRTCMSGTASRSSLSLSLYSPRVCTARRTTLNRATFHDVAPLLQLTRHQIPVAFRATRSPGTPLATIF